MYIIFIEFIHTYLCEMKHQCNNKCVDCICYKYFEELEDYVHFIVKKYINKIKKVKIKKLI